MGFEVVGKTVLLIDVAPTERLVMLLHFINISPYTQSPFSYKR